MPPYKESIMQSLVQSIRLRSALTLPIDDLSSEMTYELSLLGAQANFYSFQSNQVRDLVVLFLETVVGPPEETQRKYMDLQHTLRHTLSIPSVQCDHLITTFQGRLLTHLTYLLDQLQVMYLEETLASYRLHTVYLYEAHLIRITEEVIHVNVRPVTYSV